MQQVSAVTAPGSLWRNQHYLIFWLGQSISVLGSAMATLAVPLLVLQATSSVARMGLVSGLLAGGSVLAGIVSGVLADRFDRRTLMIGYDALSAVLFSTIPFAWWLVGPQIALLYLLAVPLGYLAIASSVAATASLPRLVNQQQLTAANSRFEATTAIAFVAGPLLAGTLIGLLGAPTILLLNALSFLVSVLSLLLIRLRPAQPEETTSAKRVPELLAGVRFLLQNRYLRWVVLVRIGILALMGGAFDLVIYRLKHEDAQTDTIVGLVWGIGSLGALGAGLLTPFLRRRLGVGACFLGGQGLIAASVIIIGLNASVAFFLVLGVLLTFGDILARILATTILQEMTPPHLQGRVMAAVLMLLWGGTALGAVASTSLAAALGSTPPVFLLMGGLIGGVALVGLFTHARQPTPETPASTREKAG